MLTPALKALADMRMRGEVPADCVWLYVGDYEQVPWWQWYGSVPEIMINKSCPTARLDLRPLVGLRVILNAQRYDAPLMQLIERLKPYVASMSVFVADWLPDCLGFRWGKGDAEYHPIGEQQMEAA